MTIKTSITLGWVLSIFLLACTDGPIKVRKGKGKNSNALHAILRLNPEQGKQYHYDITYERKMFMKINERDVESSEIVNVGTTCSFDIDLTGNKKMTIAYNKLILKSKNENGERVVDIDKIGASPNAVDGIYAGFKGAAFTVNLNEKSEVTSLSGYEELLSKISTESQIPVAVVKSLLIGPFGKAYLKQIIGSIVTYYPDSLVGVGGQWNHHTTQESDIRLKVENVYTLTSINLKTGLSTIFVNSRLSSNGEMSRIASYNVETFLNGTQKSTLEIEQYSGMIVSGQDSSEIKGTLRINGRTADTHIVTANSIKRVDAP